MNIFDTFTNIGDEAMGYKGGTEDLLLGSAAIVGAAALGPAGGAILGTVGGSVLQERRKRRLQEQQQIDADLRMKQNQERQNKLIKNQFMQKKAQNIAPGQNQSSMQGTVLTPSSDDTVSLLG